MVQSSFDCFVYIASVCSLGFDAGIISNLPRHFGALFNSHALPSDTISAHSVIFQRSLMTYLEARGPSLPGMNVRKLL